MDGVPVDCATMGCVAVSAVWVAAGRGGVPALLNDAPRGGSGGACARRRDGGTSEGGRARGRSFPLSFARMRCIATANSSRLRRPSPFMSARSL